MRKRIMVETFSNEVCIMSFMRFSFMIGHFLLCVKLHCATVHYPIKY